jgi:hypothetical protein
MKDYSTKNVRKQSNREGSSNLSKVMNKKDENTQLNCQRAN